MIGSELPKGWNKVKLLDIADLSTGKVDANHSTEDGLYPFFTCASEPMKSPDYSFDDESVIVPGNGANVGCVLYYNGKFQAYQRTYVLSNIKIVPKYLYYHFLRYWKERTENNQFGSATNYVKLINFANYIVDMPSLTEQKQIAEKLDKLFDQIETIKEASNKIPELLKNFRQQVLTYAVTGKLIESTPEPRMLGELIDELKYGTSKKADYDIEGFPVLRIPNINNGEIDSSDLKYVPLDDKEYNQLSLQEGDILVIRSNGSLSIVGQCAIVRKECENWVYAVYLIRIRCTHELLPEYLNYIFQSYQVRKQIVEKSHSMSGVNNFSADKIKQLEIAWYPVEVQKQIVEKLNSIFGKLNEIEKQYNTLCEKLDKLPQTLLCKAFKGELVYD